jgi:hypothetical protein
MTIWRRRGFVLAAFVLLAGCSNGDFGEVRPMLVRDDVHDWLGPAAAAPSAPSSFEVTDEERKLRDLAFPLIEPPYDRQQPYSVTLEYGANGTAGVTHASYANYLLSSRFRSPSGRYAQLNDDIRNDTTRLPQFFETAARVLDLDVKRKKSLAYVSSLSAAERDDALRRVRENSSLVSLVRTRLVQRVSAYRFALERLVIMTPSAQAVEVEQSLNQLQALIARYRTPQLPWVREQSLVSAR